MPSEERRARFASCLLYLYPRTWRQRYEPEMLALLEQHSISLITLLDLLLGALDAQLHSPGKKERFLFMFKNVRATTITFACAFIMYVLAQASLIGLTTSLGGLDLIRATIPFLSIYSKGSFAFVLVLLMSNLFIALPLLKDALMTKKKDVVLLAFGCLLAIPLWPWIPQVVVTILMPPVDPLRSLSTFASALYLSTLPLSTLLWSGVFVMTCLVKALLAKHHKKQASFSVGAYIIIPLILSCLLSMLSAFYIFSGSGVLPGLSVWIMSLFTSLDASLPYFLSVGAFTLTLSRKGTNRRNAFTAFIVAMALTLVMLVQTGSGVLVFFAGITGGLKPAASGFLWFDCLYMLIAVALTCITLVRWFLLLMTTPPSLQESQMAVQEQQLT
ncbi:MAG: hypothetical protein J2P37_34045 [Ktedonobacteraceae bacterium]|nr:hypothetical protein [Ktedonobacteraceae bacterium]